MYAKLTRGFEARTGRGEAADHCNIADLVLLKAVFAAAQEANVPVLVGASEGERNFLGVRQIAALVRSLREEFDFPIFLNADHTHTLAKAIEAAKARGSIPSSSTHPLSRSNRMYDRRKKRSKLSSPLIPPS